MTGLGSIEAADKPPKPEVPPKCKLNTSQCLWLRCCPDALQQPLCKAASQRGWEARRHQTDLLWHQLQHLGKPVCCRQPREHQHTRREPQDGQLTQPHAALTKEAPSSKAPPWKGQGAQPSHSGCCLRAGSSQPHPSLSDPHGSQRVWAAATLDLACPPAPAAAETANRACASLTRSHGFSWEQPSRSRRHGQELTLPALSCLQCAVTALG